MRVSLGRPQREQTDIPGKLYYEPRLRAMRDVTRSRSYHIPTSQHPVTVSTVKRNSLRELVHRIERAVERRVTWQPHSLQGSKRVIYNAE